MNRYIDQDKVIDAVLELDTTHRVSWQDAVIDMIDCMPPADVQPVVHGEWRDTGSGQECSVCGEIQYGYDSGRYYCANCGAKIDKRGGADNEVN